MGIELLWKKAMQSVERDELVGIQRVGRLAVLAADWIVSRKPQIDSFWFRTDAENWAISRFIKSAAEAIPEGSLVLDAGTGNSPYLHYFRQHVYQSCDWIARKKLTFISDLHHIPVAARTYDAVVCTQVLEHVPYPHKVIKEFYRVLQPGGRVFLTAPQGHGLHGEPHNYFYYTKYGLELLFRDAGFQDISIQELGGVFWLLGKRIRALVRYIYLQHHGAGKAVAFFIHILFAPLTQLAFPMAMFYLDPIDKRKSITSGYACTSRKPM